MSRDFPAPGGAVRAVLFDLDGTLADTERLQFEAYRRVLASRGAFVDLETYRRHFIAVGGGAEWACATFALPVDAATLRAHKAAEYRALLAEGVDAMPGVAETLAALRPARRLAVATNSLREEVAIVLAHLGIGPLLDAVVAREDYPRAKPAPDAYLAAARALGVPPAACLVVEDTPRGVAAGRAAGIRVIAVPSDLTADQDFTGAACRLASLRALTPALLDALGARDAGAEDA